MASTQNSSSKESDSEILKDRIRATVDSADTANAKELLDVALSANLTSVPVGVARAYCDGSEFVEKYLKFVEVEEVDHLLELNPQQLRTVGAMIRFGQNEKQIFKLSQKFRRPKNSEGRYSKDGVRICRIKTKGRFGRKWYFRLQVSGIRSMVGLGYDRTKAWEIAKRIKRKAEAKIGLVEILSEFHPESKRLERLLGDGAGQESSSVKFTGFSEVTEAEVDFDIPISKLIAAYLNGAKSPSIGFKYETAQRNVNQLRKVMQMGMGLTYPKKTKINDIEADLFGRQLSALSGELVYRFQDAMLGAGGDFDDIDELEKLRRSNSANSTLRQAKSIFSKKGQKIFTRAKLKFAFPHEFKDTSQLTVADSRYTLPSFKCIEGLFEVLSKLGKSNPDQYLVLMLGLFVGLRPGETKWLKKDKLQDSGYWKVCIEVTEDFVPKQYQVRRVKIPAELGRHLLDVCRENGSDYLLSGHKTQRTVDLFGEINPYLRDNFFSGVDRPCYELRKLFASACNVGHGIDLTHNRMGHKDRATTDKYYADKDAPQELADLFNQWAKKLYGGQAFEK